MDEQEKPVLTEAGKVLAVRDRTGLPLLRCKQALVRADWDVEAAIKLLRDDFLKERRPGVMYD